MLTNCSYEPHGTYLSGSTFFVPRRSQKTKKKFVIGKIPVVRNAIYKFSQMLFFLLFPVAEKGTNQISKKFHKKKGQLIFNH